MMKKNERIAKGESVLVYFDMDKQQSLPIPEEMRAVLISYRRDDDDETV